MSIARSFTFLCIEIHWVRDTFAEPNK